jgi:hypothetical protein
VLLSEPVYDEETSFAAVVPELSSNAQWVTREGSAACVRLMNDPRVVDKKRTTATKRKRDSRFILKMR